MSGGTRTRTGDTMIFSPSSYVLVCPRVSGNWAYLCNFRRFLRSRFSALFGSVLAWLQYGCSKVHVGSQMHQRLANRPEEKLSGIDWLRSRRLMEMSPHSVSKNRTGSPVAPSWRNDREISIEEVIRVYS
jgi:hypothetical protein